MAYNMTTTMTMLMLMMIVKTELTMSNVMLCKMVALLPEFSPVILVIVLHDKWRLDDAGKHDWKEYVKCITMGWVQKIGRCKEKCQMFAAMLPSLQILVQKRKMTEVTLVIKLDEGEGESII